MGVGNSTFLLDSANRLWAAGKNSCGQLGLGDTEDRLTFAEVPISLASGERILSGACGADHTTILTKRGLYVAGNNTFGQLGIGREDIEQQLTFAKLPIHWPPEEILSVACGISHTILLTNERLYAAGNNVFGQLGLGNITNHFSGFTQVPLPLVSGEQILSGACGAAHTTILTKRGLYVAGGNRTGQLGLGNRADQFMFIKVPTRLAAEQIKSVSCGDFHTAVLAAGNLYMAGFNRYGQLGLGIDDNPHVAQFVKVANFPPSEEQILSVICGGLYTVVITNGGLYVAGNNEFGQLGLGNTENKNVFVRVPMPMFSEEEKIESVTCGQNHTCVLTNCGPYMAGNNEFGQLGSFGKQNQNKFVYLWPRKRRPGNTLYDQALNHIRANPGFFDDNSIRYFFGWESKYKKWLPQELANDVAAKQNSPFVVKVFC